MKNIAIAIMGIVFFSTAVVESAWAASAAPRTKAPASAELYFITPQDGESVGHDVIVRFGLKGMGVAPAGVISPNTGHHHLLIDVSELPPMDLPIANDASHMHFGGGQTETVLHLTPGDHTLQLLLGDALHVPLDPPVLSKRITIHVK